MTLHIQGAWQNAHFIRQLAERGQGNAIWICISGLECHRYWWTYSTKRAIYYSLEFMAHVGQWGQWFFSMFSCPMIVWQPLTAAPVRYVIRPSSCWSSTRSVRRVIRPSSCWSSTKSFQTILRLVLHEVSHLQPSLSSLVIRLSSCWCASIASTHQRPLLYQLCLLLCNVVLPFLQQSCFWNRSSNTFFQCCL